MNPDRRSPWKRMLAVPLLALTVILGGAQCSAISGNGPHTHCLQNGGDVTNNRCSGFGF